MIIRPSKHRTVMVCAGVGRRKVSPSVLRNTPQFGVQFICKYLLRWKHKTPKLSLLKIRFFCEDYLINTISCERQLSAAYLGKIFRARQLLKFATLVRNAQEIVILCLNRAITRKSDVSLILIRPYLLKILFSALTIFPNTKTISFYFSWLPVCNLTLVPALEMNDLRSLLS